jgi:hypothetical protein
MIDGVFAQVKSVRDALADCFRVLSEDGLPRRDITAIQPRLQIELRNSHGLLRGIGVVLAPGVLMDARLWIDWWVMNDAGGVQAAAFDFDQHSLNFNDYTVAEWYRSPQQGHERCLIGPYVDFNGLNDYIVTATMPVDIEGHFVGVAGADLRLDEIERRLYAGSRRSGGELVILNSSDRIVASTSVRYIAGSLLRLDAHPKHDVPSDPTRTSGRPVVGHPVGFCQRQHVLT